MALASLVPQGGFPLVLSRATFVAALISLNGVLVFRLIVMPKVAARSTPKDLRTAERALKRLQWLALVVGVIELAVWTVLQAAELAEATRPGDIAAALGPVLADTQFGHLVLLQGFGLLLTALFLRSSGPVWAALVTSGDLAAQAGHGHGMAMGGLVGPLVWVDVAHLLAAAGWIGGLLPLLLVVRLAPFRSAALAARWFSPFGQWCVCVMVASALVEGWILVGGFRPLFGTAYGWVMLAKIACFGVLLALALLNRFRLAPALLGERPEQARRRLIGSIAWQTAAGLLAVTAAGLLSGLAPGMDMGRG